MTPPDLLKVHRLHVWCIFCTQCTLCTQAFLTFGRLESVKDGSSKKGEDRLSEEIKRRQVSERSLNGNPNL